MRLHFEGFVATQPMIPEPHHIIGIRPDYRSARLPQLTELHRDSLPKA